MGCSGPPVWWRTLAQRGVARRRVRARDGATQSRPRRLRSWPTDRLDGRPWAKWFLPLLAVGVPAEGEAAETVDQLTCPPYFQAPGLPDAGAEASKRLRLWTVMMGCLNGKSLHRKTYFFHRRTSLSERFCRSASNSIRRPEHGPGHRRTGAGGRAHSDRHRQGSRQSRATRRRAGRARQEPARQHRHRMRRRPPTAPWSTLPPAAAWRSTAPARPRARPRRSGPVTAPTTSSSPAPPTANSRSTQACSPCASTPTARRVRAPLW